MAIVAHVSEQNINSGVVGGVQLGNVLGILVDGDLTSLATAKANVDTAAAKLPTPERLFATRVKASLDQADNYLSGATTGSSISNITALEPAGGRNGRQLRF